MLGYCTSLIQFSLVASSSSSPKINQNQGMVELGVLVYLAVVL
uniref:Uncharacterized protein n=1 Tax=Rhizophora mucronata TaxID=61149 RepID=A0A2P2J2R9_RHIMU